MLASVSRPLRPNIEAIMSDLYEIGRIVHSLALQSYGVWLQYQRCLVASFFRTCVTEKLDTFSVPQCKAFLKLSQEFLLHREPVTIA